MIAYGGMTMSKLFLFMAALLLAILFLLIPALAGQPALF